MKYKKEIIKLLERINDERFLKMIYGFVKALYEESTEV